MNKLLNKIRKICEELGGEVLPTTPRTIHPHCIDEQGIQVYFEHIWAFGTDKLNIGESMHGGISAWVRFSISVKDKSIYLWWRRGDEIISEVLSSQMTYLLTKVSGVKGIIMKFANEVYHKSYSGIKNEDNFWEKPERIIDKEFIYHGGANWFKS